MTNEQLVGTQPDLGRRRNRRLTTLRLGIVLAFLGVAASLTLAFMSGGAGPSTPLAVTALSGVALPLESLGGPTQAAALDHPADDLYVSADPLVALRGTVSGGADPLGAKSARLVLRSWSACPLGERSTWGWTCASRRSPRRMAAAYSSGLLAASSEEPAAALPGARRLPRRRKNASEPGPPLCPPPQPSTRRSSATPRSPAGAHPAPPSPRSSSSPTCGSRRPRARLRPSRPNCRRRPPAGAPVPEY